MAVIIKSLFNDLTPSGEIAGWEELTFERGWNVPGGFRIVINSNNLTAQYLALDKILIIDDDSLSVLKYGYIDKITVEARESQLSEVIIAEGRELKDRLDRVIYPPSGQATDSYTNEYAETVVKELLDKNLGSSATGNRPIPNIDIQPDLNRGTQINYSARYKDLLTEIYAILQAQQLGFTAAVNLTSSKIEFDVAEGVDRKAVVGSSGGVLLSTANASIRALTDTEDATTLKNLSITAGQGVGAARTLLEVGATSATGYDRREVYTDARDINSDTELTNRGNQKLAETEKSTGVNITYNQFGAYQIESNFDLGDFVSYETAIRSGDAQVVKIIYRYAGREVPDIIPILDFDVEDALATAITAKHQNYDSLVAKEESGGGGTGDVVGPASSTDNAISRFNGTSGKIIQNSIPTVEDDGSIANWRTLQPYLLYSSTGSEPVGTSWWNKDEETWDVKLNAAVTGQVFEELLPNVKNQTGSTIADGRAVMFAGTLGASGRILIQEMIADGTFLSGYFVGLTTQSLANGADGKITWFGKVRGVDTTGTPYGETWADGDILYVSNTVAGALTNIEPSGPNQSITVGVVVKAHTNGTIFVRPTWYGKLDDLDDVSLSAKADFDLLSYDVLTGLWKNKTLAEALAPNSEVTKEFTGFAEPLDVIVTGDSATRTVTLTGTVNAYYQGEKNTTIISGWTSPAHGSDTAKQYFLEFDGTSIVWFDASAGLSETFYQNLLISFAFHDPTNSVWVYLREPHGLMPWQTHREFHQTTGTYRRTGGSLTNYTEGSTTAADRRPDIESTLLYDEDLPTQNPVLNSGLYSQFYLTGADGDVNNAINQADIVPLSGNQPYWNEFTGGSWQQTLMANNSYMAVWVLCIPMAADANSQQWRYLFIQGQTNDGSLSNIQALTPQDVSIGKLRELLPELVVTNKIIIEYRGGNWSIAEVAEIFGTSQSQVTAPGGNFLTAVSSDNTMTGQGTTASPLGVDGGAVINLASAETEISTDDEIGFADTSASSILKKITWANFVTAVKNLLVSLGLSREVLTANRTYYVDPQAGDDTEDGLTTSTALKTIGKAEELAQALDTAGYNVDIDLWTAYTGTGAATYTLTSALIIRKPLGAGRLRYIGDTTDNTNVVIQGAVDNLVQSISSHPGEFVIEDLTIKQTGSGFTALKILTDTTLKLNNLVIDCNGGSAIFLQKACAIQVFNNLTLVGSFSNVVFVNTGGGAAISSSTIDVSAVTSFSNFFNIAGSGAQITHAAVTYTAYTNPGRQYVVQVNGSLTIGGATIPGTAGITATGGVAA